MATKLSIISSALALIGAQPLQSLDDDTIEAMAATMMYDTTYESMLTICNWSFAKDVIQLNRTTQTPDYGYKYVYRVKGTVLKVINLNNSNDINYKLLNGNEIHTDKETATITALVKVDENQLPADFINALTFELAGVLAPIITDTTTTTERFLALARQKLGQARIRDSQQQPATYTRHSPLVTARGGNSWLR